MTALGITTLQIRIADFKFSHNFIICDRLPEKELLFGIDVQKKFSMSYTWDRQKNCYIQKGVNSLSTPENCEKKANVAVVKSALRIPPRHNGFVPIKVKGHAIKGHMAYFISDQDSKKKRKTPTYTSLMESITSKKHMFTFQTTPSKHITFNKGEYVGHLETTYRRLGTDSRRSRITNNPQHCGRKDDGQEG